MPFQQITHDQHINPDRQFKVGFIRVLCTIVCVFFHPVSVFANEVHDILEEAQQAYDNRRYNASLERLEQAINLIKDVQAARIIKFFPEPQPGWMIAENTENSVSPLPNAELGILSSVMRRYTPIPQKEQENLLATDTGKNAVKNKTAVEPWIQFMLLQKPNGLIKMAFQGMYFLKANAPDSHKMQLEGHEGIVHCDKKQNTCDAFFNFNEAFILMVNSEKVSKATLELYLKAFDVAGLMAAE